MIMTDFAKLHTNAQADYCVRSLMDVDFYKFTMGQFIWKHYPNAQVTFKLILRDTDIPLARVINEQELRDQLDHVQKLRFRKTDLYYLRGMDVYGKNMFEEGYIDFLRNLRLPDYTLVRKGDSFELYITGTWAEATFWETIALAIISELYYRALMQTMSRTEVEMMYGRATDRLYYKLKQLSRDQSIKIADFGQRRRHSFLWQKRAIEMCKEMLGENFVGTSNTWMAFNQDLTPIGTNAHELPMGLTAMAADEDKAMAQYTLFKPWQEMYGAGLRIFLPDTYGSEQFFNNMPDDVANMLARNWRGMRQDSGDSASEAMAYLKWLDRMGLSNDEVKNKLCIFSDGLDVDPIVSLNDQFTGIFNTSYGWGTNLTNDFRDCHPKSEEVIPGLGQSWNTLFRPFSVVCKIVEVDGNPAVKLSNNVNKATGDPEEVKKYLELFGHAGRVTQQVEV